MRFAIHRSTWIKPLLLPFGGTESRSYVDIENDVLDIRFGFLFHERIPIQNIASVEREEWPVLAGLGWRTNLVDSIAVVGSYSNVVKLRLSKPSRMSVIFPVNTEMLHVSVEDPDAFVAEIRRRIADREKRSR